MIVTKTPLRVSFFGGGSDIPEFYENNEGMVVSTTINSYIYLAVNRCVAPHLKVIYSVLELENDIDNIKHDRVRETLKYFGMTTNMEICSFSDVPTKGTGLGSSSTFTVGLINALYGLMGNTVSDQYNLAELASHIEINLCNEPIGKQDQFAAAYGGLNQIIFNPHSTEIIPIKISSEIKETLNSRLMCFNTGISRQASSVLTKQVENLKINMNVNMTKSMVEMAKHSIQLLRTGKLDDFGGLLDDAWQIKKMLSDNISTPLIDEMYETALTAGALGGKILGAGGGGYLLLYVPDKNRSSVLSAMSSYDKFDFTFTNKGSTVEMHS